MKNYPMKKIYYLLVLALCFSSLGFGQIAAYSGTSSPNANAVANVTATSLTRGSGISAASGTTFNSGDWTTNSSIDTNDYVEWSISAASGYQINISSLQINYDKDEVFFDFFGTRSGGTGPTRVALRSSLDGYSADLFTDTNININGETNTITTSLMSAISGTITFRLYGYAASTGFFNTNYGTFDIEGGLGTVLSVANTGIRIDGTVINTNCTPPNLQASNFSATNINSPTSGNATINWTRGNGNNVLVVVRAGTAVTTDPTSGTPYTANTIFGSAGTQLGAGYVVYNGNGSSVNISGLSENTIYYVAIYEYNNTGICYKKPSLAGNFTVPCVTPINVTALASTPANQQVAINWTNSACFDEVLVVARATSAITAVPTGNGSTYTANSYFGAGTAILPGQFVVYKGVGTAVTTTNLINGTIYRFKVFTRKGNIWSSGVSISATPNTSAYCSSQSNNLTDEWISRVRIRTISPVNNLLNNASGSTAYSDFTGSVAAPTLTKNTQYTVSITPAWGGQTYAERYYVYVDYNQDGIFSPSEQIFTTGPTTTSPVNGNFTIPFSAALGTTRMRVVMSYFDISSTVPCGSNSYGEVEDYNVNITGNINYIYDNGWTPANPSGISTISDNINVLQGNAIISSNTKAGNVIVSQLGAVTVNSGAILQVAGALNLLSTNLRYSSLMADGIIIGTINYNRHVNGGTGVGVGDGANDLIASPLASSQNFGQFAQINGNIKSNPNPGMGTQKLFGPFLKPNGTYLLWDSVADAGETILPGVGYRAASTDNLGFLFTGTVNQGIVTRDILYSTAPGATFKQWNLVGNPYPAYINVGEFLNYEVATGVTNADLLENTGTAIYGYDGDADNGWTIWNLNTPTRNITPGQGFFVKADPAMVAAHDLTFAPSMRVIGNTDDFIPGRMANPNNSHLKLGALIGSANYHTDFYFNDNSTSGLDRGYDAAVYGNTATSKAIYSRLVENSTGIDMGIQSLATTALGSDIVVPLGINAPQGQQVTVSIAESDLPENIAVYLEDNVTGTFTLLNDSDYVFTPNATLNSTGRFFLRFSDQTLSAPDTAIGALQIYTTSAPRALFVKGQLDGTTSITMYDVQGRAVLSSQLEQSSNLNQVDVSSLSSGVYVVKISNSSQQKTQKVILK